MAKNKSAKRNGRPKPNHDAIEVPKATLELVLALKPHPRNYRKHPDDQLAQIIASIRQHGVYRNIVVAQDGTILAGHGVSEACRRLGITHVPVIRLPIASDDVRALKLLTGDNELGHLSEVDDRQLTELLKEIKDVDVEGLIGTGFDDAMLAALVYTTRPQSEIQNKNHAADWTGMPGYDPGTQPLQLLITFEAEADRERFVAEKSLKIKYRMARVWSTSWPWDGQREDSVSLRFEAAGKAKP